ncbi:uncharacterized protein LOC128555209 [Mercenaria mercenaria]|uniref:uncharacterized protein LOC128555209 n=1 Tax=Mercenaria mercenaria TaxID=6596 RepID=UPI00234F54B7|nr:uncharacterized protein LOC128555209 [Mercenaria mercenaria]
MTCVLHLTSSYTTHFNEGNATAALQNKGGNVFDFDWINTQHLHDGKSGVSTGSSISDGTDISKGLPTNVKHEQLHLQAVVHTETELDLCERGSYWEEKHTFTNDKQALNNSCKKKYIITNQKSTNSHGIKRKAEEMGFDEAYIPSKRVSPFLNTPKERKDIRRNILKLSVKKLKQLDDPEAFLRRTVLVNNTMKRLQVELLNEKRRNRENESCDRKCFYGYSEFSKYYMSNFCLLDYPYLSGEHEKITDDMTDTLMNNVLNDKVDAHSNICSSQTASLYVSEDQHPSRKSSSITESGKDCICQFCLDNRKDIMAKSVDRYHELGRVCKRNEDNSAENAKSIGGDDCEEMQLGKMAT